MPTTFEDLKKLRELGAFSPEQEEDIKRLEEIGALESNAEEVIKWLSAPVEEKAKPPVVEEPVEEEEKPAKPQPGLTDKLPEPETPVSKAPSLGKFIVGAGEVGLSGLTSAFAVPASGFVGGLRAIAEGPEKGAETIEEIQQAFTYQPRGESAKTTASGLAQVASDIGDPAMQAYEKGVVEPVSGAMGEWLGPEAAGITGAALTTVPLAMAERFGPRIGKPVKSHRGGKYRTPEEVERTQFLESKGLTPEADAAPTRAQITQTARDIAEEDRLAAVKGEDVPAHLEKQSKILEKNMRDAVNRTSHTAKEGDLPIPTGEANQIVDITNNYVKQGEALINKAYEAAKRESGGKEVVKPTNLITTLRKLHPADKAVNHVVSAMKNFARDMKVFERVGPGKTKLSSVDTMEELVKRANGLYSNTDPNVNRVLRQIKSAIDKDVAASGGTKLFQQARAFTNNFYKSMDRSTTTSFAKKKNSIVQDILDDRTMGDDLVSNVLLKKKYDSRDISDLREFTLAQEGGKQAWQNFRADVTDYILDNSLVEKGGVQVLSRKKFEAVLKRLGTEKRVRQIFSEKEFKELADLSRALKLIDRPATAGTKARRLEGLQRWWDNKSRRLKELAVVKTLADLAFDPQKQALTLPMDYKFTRVAGALATEEALEKE